MRLMIPLPATIFIVGLVGCAGAQTSAVSDSYSVLLTEPGQTWCGYTNQAEFQSEAMKLKPTESARVTYTANKLAELTYQVEAESGDWIVVDKYTSTDRGIALRRANLLAQENLEVIQEAVIREGKIEPFRIVSVTTLDGKKTKLPVIDFPEVEVRGSLSAFRFLDVVAEIRRRSLTKLCKSTE